MRSSTRISALAALLLSLTSPPARADGVEDARRHFTEGVKRYQDGDFEGARALFQQANAEHHAPSIVYNVARAEERLGHPQAAVEAYDAYLAEAGEQGEFAQASALAIARIRASSRVLRVETSPPGARVFVNGAPTRDPAPTRVLVPAGRHHVVAEGDGWRAEADVETGPASVETVTLAQPQDARAVREPAPPTAQASPAAPAVAATEGSSGFVFGAEFTLVPHRFDRTGSKPFTAFGLAAGAMIEAGFAPSNDFVVLGRTLVAVGSQGEPATTLAAIGVGLSYRVRPSIWMGGAFLGGRALLPGAITPAANERLRFDTDYVFCPTLELSIAVLTRPYGQWLVSVFPGYYFASPADNDALFVPVGFGLRSF